jgi:DNA-binding CsgD family transcriptional regulator
MQQVGTEWLDRNTAAVVLLDERGHTLLVNRSARAMQSKRDGIWLSADGIGLSRKQDNDKLQCMIGRTLAPAASPTISTGGSMRAIRPSGKQAYGIFVAPMSRQIAALSLFRPAVCVVIIDPDVQPALPVKRLQVIFGLTEAEARLASLVSAGKNLRSAAADLQITYGTARTRLAQIFQKTRTRRQGEVFGFAGLWDSSTGADGVAIESCAILAMPANQLMTEIHNVKHRMPAILSREDRETWLTGAPGDAFKAIKQYPDTHMVATPISTRVNTPKNNDARLIEAIVA